MKWVKLRRKTHVAYKSEDKKYFLSPITAPTGPGLPKFILYSIKEGKVDRFCGTFHEIKFATEQIKRWEKVT